MVHPSTSQNHPVLTVAMWGHGETLKHLLAIRFTATNASGYLWDSRTYSFDPKFHLRDGHNFGTVMKAIINFSGSIKSGKYPGKISVSHVGEFEDDSLQGITLSSLLEDDRYFRCVHRPHHKDECSDYGASKYLSIFLPDYTAQYPRTPTVLKKISFIDLCCRLFGV